MKRSPILPVSKTDDFALGQLQVAKCQGAPFGAVTDRPFEEDGGLKVARATGSESPCRAQAVRDRAARFQRMEARH